MKKLLTILIIFCKAIVYAQGGAMADLKFEEAEIAFNKQDFETSIKKLDEFDKLMGNVKDKSLYLRIVSQDKLFQPSKLYENEKQFNMLASLRKYTAAYLKTMENGELDDRYREVYKINEKLQQYAKDKASWQLEKEKRERVAAELIKIKAENKQKWINQIKAYDQKKDQYYREIAQKIDAWEYKEGIKIGMSFNELMQTKKDWFKGHRTDKNYSSYKKPWNAKDEILEKVKADDNGRIVYYEFRTKNEDSVNLTKMKQIFGEHFVPDLYQNPKYSYNFIYFIIQSPYTKNKIILNYHGIAKVDSQYIKRYFFEPLLDYAVDINYLDRFIGTYENMKNYLNIQKHPILPFIRLIGPEANFYYRLEPNSKNKFSCIFYKMKDKHGEEVGDKVFNNSGILIFNLEEGYVSKKWNDNKEEIFTRKF